MKEYLQRPEESHGVDGIACSQLQTICAIQNWAVDRVKEDYGEDLMIQTTHSDSNIDHFKTWIQVKGTSDIEKYRQKSGDLVRYIDFAHLYKWLRSTELCILILWDTNKNRGLYFIPKDEVDEWAFYTERSESIRICFDDSHVVDAKSMPSLAWRSRINHFQCLIASSFIQNEVINTQGTLAVYNAVIIDFFKIIGVICKDESNGGFIEFSNTFRQRVCNAISNISGREEEKETEPSVIIRMAIALGIVTIFEDKVEKWGYPSEILDPCIDRVLQMSGFLPLIPDDYL